MRPIGRRGARGQSLIEYAVLLVAVVSALTFMYAYLQNAFSHRIKSGADGMGHGVLYR